VSIKEPGGGCFVLKYTQLKKGQYLMRLKQSQADPRINLKRRKSYPNKLMVKSYDIRKRFI